MVPPTDQIDRLRILVEAGISLSAELSLDALLQRIVETAAQLTGARYGALGVVDQSGRMLERLLTTGMDDETRAGIGDEPVGRGILGVLIRDRKPLRLHDIADDPRSVGFPPNHPPMQTFLGVPILLRGVAYGNLYLTEKEDGADFTDDDEELTQLVAAQAAVAIENARLHESSERWLRQLESLNEIGSALSSQLELEPLLSIVAARLRELVRARLVLIALPDTADTLRVAAAEGAGAAGAIGTHLRLGTSKIGRVLERARSERVDAMLEDPEVDQQTARDLSVTTALYVPLIVRGRAVGVIAAHDKEGSDLRFDDEDSRLGESLAERAAIAFDLSQRVSRDAIRRVVEAQELERTRLARELHDETGQALTSILLGLKTLERAVETDHGREGVAAVRELVVSTLQDVRRLALELRPGALDDFGLAPALERLAETVRQATSVEIDLEVGIGGNRLPADVETTMYRIVQEALTNISKHSDATRVSILLARKQRAVVIVVEDDGGGFNPGAKTAGLGLAGMRERVELHGGQLRIETSPGRGTTIVAEVPLQ
ncbi:MAG: GAF domain-containing protein [Thermoleophilia bacterium]|nr:GAF domain-containing protein [Thermoleophilia bacterium]